jgi:hypothetical protein
MNYANVVSDSYSPSTQVSKNESGKTETSDAFAMTFNEYVRENKEDLDVSKPSGISTPLGDAFLVLPTYQNVVEISSYLEEQLELLFSENSIPVKPPIEIDYDYVNNKVVATGDRGDIEEINELLNSDDNVKETVHSVLAISSFYANIQDDLLFQEEYRNSSDPESVVRKYAHLFNGSNKYEKVTFMFGEASGVLVNGMVMDDFKAELEASFKS